MQAFQVWLYPWQQPQNGKKGGNKMCIYLCKRTKVKINDIAYLRFLRVRTDQCKYIKLGFNPDRNPKGVIKRGKKIDIYLCKKKQC